MFVCAFSQTWGMPSVWEVCLVALGVRRVCRVAVPLEASFLRQTKRLRTLFAACEKLGGVYSHIYSLQDCEDFGGGW